MKVEATRPALASAAASATGLQVRAEGRAFASTCPPDKRFKVEDLFAFRRGRGDLVFSAFMAVLALFFLAMFWGQTGWAERDLPEDMGSYLARQFGLIEGEGRLERLGRILKQGWVAPLICLMILVPAALWNLRSSLRNFRWRQRFRQPTALGHELTQWLRALQFVGWFIAYTLLVPVLGYLASTLLLGTALPWRLGYRGRRWLGICASASLMIVLIFRTGLQIRTPVNVWLYDLLPGPVGAFMKTWF